MSLDQLPSVEGASADQHAVKADFAERLKAAIERKGWSASEAARQVSRFLDPGDKFGRAHLWQYLQGRALPRSRYLLALSRALDLDPRELLPGRAVFVDDPARPVVPGVEHGAFWGDRSDLVHVRDYGDGTALLQVSQRVSWETALTLVQILKRRDD